MDKSSLHQAIESSQGLPTASLFKKIEQARANKTLNLPPLSQVSNAANSRPPVTFPDVEEGSYKYSPLPTSTSIRLLKILGLDEDGLLRCSLVTVDLEEKPIYNCLSYTWGNPHAESYLYPHSEELKARYSTETTWPISLNNKIFYVGQNLYDALQEMPKHFWAHVRDGERMTVLHRAAKRGESMIAWSALIHGAKVNCKDRQGRSPLHYAAQSGNMELVELLINAGAEMDPLDGEGKSPLTYAQEHEHHDVVQYLIKLGKKSDELQPSVGPRGHGVPSFFWIDAICICQSDLSERGHQVRLMDKIYAGAECVSIWLGESDALTEHAVDAVTQIAQCYKKFAASEIIPFSRNESHVFEAAGIQEISLLQWDALVSLYLRKWFSRAWIVQETVVARQILVWCGAHEFIFDDICAVTEALCHRCDVLGYKPSAGFVTGWKGPGQASTSTTDGNITNKNFYDAAHGIEDQFNAVVKIKTNWNLSRLPMEIRMKYANWNTDHSLSLGQLIYETLLFECQDPRDKIYSLLALAVSKSDSLDIVPDYKKTAEEVYAQVTRYMIAKRQDLGILYNIPVSARNNLPDLPSWVLDFSRKGIAAMQGSPFNAAGAFSKRALLPLSDNWRQLRVEGSQLDRVIEIGNAVLEGIHPHLDFDPGWYKLISKLDQTYSTGESRCEVLWRTLCLDQDIHQKCPAPVEYRDQFRDVVCAMICAEGDRIMAEKAATTKLAYELLRSMVLAQGLSQEDSERATSFAVAVNEAKEPPSRDIRGPYYDHIRESLNLIDDIAIAQTESALPTLDQVEGYRSHGGPRLLNAGRYVMMPETPAFLGRDNNFLRTSYRFHRRRLFRTEKNYLGLGPISVLPGDGVWIIAGMNRPSVPFILRPRETGTYRLVGTTYIHGVMHGEAITPQTAFEEIKLE